MHSLFPTTTAVRIDLNPSASGLSTVVVSTIDVNDAGHICYLRFGSTVNTTATTSDFQMPGNAMYRFNIGPATRWMSLKLDSAQTNPFEVDYYLEGKND